MENVEGRIKELLGAEFVQSVTICPDENFDGENILRITVVYDETKGNITADEIANITREVWHLLEASEERAFPVTSFMSSRDLQHDHAA